MEVKNVAAELATNPDGSFLNIVPFNGNHIGACSITGVSPVWEMHPDTDEWFYILEGEFEMTLLSGETPQHIVAEAGSTFVVPKGIWHKPGAPKGSKFMYLTPGQTLHSDQDDPRNS
ncbi:MAG: cupin domain-containing protein [Leptolyngbya sp. SIO3F4]|nr:cupin domain-containing protein [Leptolyngbya sp. SIO3F4]